MNECVFVCVCACSKLRHVVEEMITTEREYVRSLHYVVHHYFPEMERRDLPQDLRGKRSVIFGNLEKLLDFHSQFFLKELEACWRHPLRVPHCFIRHVGDTCTHKHIGGCSRNIITGIVDFIVHVSSRSSLVFTPCTAKTNPSLTPCWPAMELLFSG